MMLFINVYIYIHIYIHLCKYIHDDIFKEYNPNKK